MDDEVIMVGRICERHGPYRARRWVFPGDVAIESSCPACREESETASRRASQEAALFDFRLKLSLAGVGSRYFDSSFENYRADREEAVLALEQLRSYVARFHPRRSPNLVMWGETGYGKTHLACAVARELILKGFTVTYLPVLTMFTQYQDITSYSSKNDESRESFFSRMRSPDLLILDEFGITSMTEKEKIVFHRVIDERYNRSAPICLVGNTDVYSFKEIIGERAERRVLDNADIVEFKWQKGAVNYNLFADGEFKVEVA